MSRSRVRFLTFVLLALIGAHLRELVKDREHWPFCSYPMYSFLETERTVVAQRLVGVRADNGDEITLHAREFLFPFDQSRLAEAFRLIDASPDAGTRWPRAVSDLFDRYERRRRAGLHSGPELRGMRVYRTRHELRPDAANLPNPEFRELLAQTANP